MTTPKYENLDTAEKVQRAFAEGRRVEIGKADGYGMDWWRANQPDAAALNLAAGYEYRAPESQCPAHGGEVDDGGPYNGIDWQATLRKAAEDFANDAFDPQKLRAFLQCVEDVADALPAQLSTDAAYPTGSDREVLLYLMQQFDAESFECPCCGHAEDCATMDSADYLRRYLAAHAAEEPQA